MQPKGVKKKSDITLAVTRNSGYYFVLFFGLVLIAFWTSYFGKLGEPMETHVHLHGLAMTLWCVMLISQAFLIRWKKYALHRLIGKGSYLLVPFILYSGFHIARMTIRNMGIPGDALHYYFAALMFNSLLVFALFYGLAIAFRKKPALHSRWMVCTVFPLITPVTDRIIYHYLDDLVPMVPTLHTVPMVQVIGFALADLILLLLVAIDLLRHQRNYAFPIALGVLLLYHLSVLTWYDVPAWQNIADWIMALP